MEIHLIAFSNTLAAYVQEGYGTYLVYVCVCLSVWLCVCLFASAVFVSTVKVVYIIEFFFFFYRSFILQIHHLFSWCVGRGVSSKGPRPTTILSHSPPKMRRSPLPSLDSHSTPEKNEEEEKEEKENKEKENNEEESTVCR